MSEFKNISTSISNRNVSLCHFDVSISKLLEEEFSLFLVEDLNSLFDIFAHFLRVGDRTAHVFGFEIPPLSFSLFWQKNSIFRKQGAMFGEGIKGGNR